MIGCLCIHGFTGGPYEVEPLAQYLCERTDWLIEVPCLPGHGEELRLKGITYDQWLQTAEEELIKLMKKCHTVYVVGFSMGGVIAGYLATKYDVQKLVLLSAAAYYINPKQMLSDIRGMIRDSFTGRLKENPLFVRYKTKIIYTPLTATFEFRKLVSEVRPMLKEISVPTLIVQGEKDGIVPLKSAHYLYETIRSPVKKLLFLPSSGHLVCHGPDRQQLFVEVEKFLQENLS
jgi:carboxylesterase